MKIKTQADLISAKAEYVLASFNRGYVSRKSTPEQRPVVKAGGIRKGLVKVFCPTRDSSRYCRVEYYRLPEGAVLA